MKQQILDIINNNSSSNGDFGTVIQDCDLDKIASEISNQLERVVNATLAEDDKIKQAGFEILNANIENRIERFEMFTPAFDETVMCYFVWIKQKP